MIESMKRNPFSPVDIIVGLDTCVVRSLAYDTPAWFETFGSMRAGGVQLCLLDNVPVELLNQLEQERLTFAEYQLAIQRTSTFVSPTLPVLPGGRDLAWMAGCSEASPKDLSPKEFGDAIWGVMRTAKSLEDLKAPVLTGPLGRQCEIAIDPGTAEQHLADARAHWSEEVKTFDPLPANAIAKHKAEVLQGMQASLRLRASSLPTLDVRYDLAIRHRLRIAVLRNQTDVQYNPDSKKRRNDGIDFTMASALALPALIVTEKNYHDIAKLLGSFQAEWVYTPESLAESWEKGLLKPPTWPSEATQS